MVARRLALAILIGPGLVLASAHSIPNDGFFWGAGDTVRAINNPNLRVVQEDLILKAIDQPPCYAVLFHGAPLADQPRLPVKPGEFAVVGPRRACPSTAEPL